MYDGKDPIYGVQTYAVPAGSGAMLEFYIPEAGVYPFVDTFHIDSLFRSLPRTFQRWRTKLMPEFYADMFEGGRTAFRVDA